MCNDHIYNYFVELWGRFDVSRVDCLTILTLTSTVLTML